MTWLRNERCTVSSLKSVIEKAIYHNSKPIAYAVQHLVVADVTLNNKLVYKKARYILVDLSNGCVIVWQRTLNLLSVT